MEYKKINRLLTVVAVALVMFITVVSNSTFACSTLKLQKGDELLYCHNLNANGMDIPGMVFVNKRGTFKKGRSWSELINKDQSNPSSLCWISKYGSVTFNTFGKDLPDGGLNEVGLYIWEMGLDTQYPKNPALPKLCQMHWMQYVLDNFSTIDEVIKSTSEIEIDGWGWHYFVGDMDGNCASIEFIKGEVIIHKGGMMPVPALLNAPYAREVELSRYFKGFGGFYEPALDDIRIPRYVKVAVMLKDYKPSQNPVDYAFLMLKNLTVNEPPDWSVVFDVHNQNVYFKTSYSPAIKKFSTAGLDFSNNSPAMILNIDIKEGADVTSRFHPFSVEEVRSLIDSLPLPEQFFGVGGLKKEEYVNRLANHTLTATSEDNQYFKGVWKTQVGDEKADQQDGTWELTLSTKGDAVIAEIANPKIITGKTPVQHLQMTDNKLSFTFRSTRGTIFEVKAVIEKDRMTAHLFGIEDDFGSVVLYRQK